MRYDENDFYNDFPDRISALAYVIKLKSYTVRLYKQKTGVSYVDRFGNHYNPLKDTVFYDARLPLNKWFYAVFLLHYSEYWSVRRFAKEIGVTPLTAFRILKKLRPVVDRKMDFISLLNKLIKGN